MTDNDIHFIDKIINQETVTAFVRARRKIVGHQA